MKYRFNLYYDDSVIEIPQLTLTIESATGDIRECDEKILDWARKKNFGVERINHSGKTVSLTAPFCNEFDTLV